MVDAVTCKSELRRLADGPLKEEPIPGIGIAQLTVKCDGNAQQVLDVAVSVMEAVCLECANGWSGETDWRSVLPNDFLCTFGREMTDEEAERWLEHWQSLSEKEREVEEDRLEWTLDNWIHWMQPGERLWHWWDAKVESADRISVSVVVESWPFGWGALTWLFRASGAIDVVPLEQTAD